MWATVLALIWLHGFKRAKKAEWELLSLKAASWLNDQNGIHRSVYFLLIIYWKCSIFFHINYDFFFPASCVTECVAAGNALLGCSVQGEAIGIWGFPWFDFILSINEKKKYFPCYSVFVLFCFLFLNFRWMLPDCILCIFIFQYFTITLLFTLVCYSN